MELLAGRAVYWEARRTLIVADVHLGKCATFRSMGVAVPELLGEDLTRLSTLVARHRAERLLVLGDLLHASLGLTEHVIERVRLWRDALGAEVEVVPGNHDRALERVAGVWGMRVLDDVHVEEPFVFRHDPAPDDRGYVLCGHVHPAVSLSSGSDRMKLACYWLGERVGVLPAFSRFTSGASVRRGVGDRVFAIVEDRVIEV
ncbi:MAG: ligase-associated DNA damage response endonuclease PdeM [Phycisphaerales bacterium]